MNIKKLKAYLLQQRSSIEDAIRAFKEQDSTAAELKAFEESYEDLANKLSELAGLEAELDELTKLLAAQDDETPQEDQPTEDSEEAENAVETTETATEAAASDEEPQAEADTEMNEATETRAADTAQMQVRSAVFEETKQTTQEVEQMTKLTVRDKIRELVKRDSAGNIKQFAEDFKNMIATRGVSNAQVAVPTDLVEVIVDVMKEDKLFAAIDIQVVSGRARYAVFGEMPEAFWTAKGIKKDHNYKIAYAELSDYTLENYIAIQNEHVEDLGNYIYLIITELADSVLRKLQKEIFVGDGSNSCVGIKTFLATTSKPAYYNEETRGTYTAVKTTNVVEVKCLGGGKAGYLELVKTLGLAKKHQQTKLHLCMNEATYRKLLVELAQAETGFTAALATAADQLPLLGDVILTEALADDNVVLGYFKNYKGVIRRDLKTEVSTDYMFGENQTCYKVTVRTDGTPLFADSFVDITLKAADSKAK